jgi:hypothetical protein
MAATKCEACDTTMGVKRRSNGWDLCDHCHRLQQEATSKGCKVWGVYTVDGEGVGTVETTTAGAALVKAKLKFKQPGIWVEELDA